MPASLSITLELTPYDFRSTILKVGGEVVVFVRRGDLQRIRFCWIGKWCSARTYWIACSRNVVSPDLGAIAREAEGSLRGGCDRIPVNITATTTGYGIVFNDSNITMNKANESALTCS